MVVPTTETRTVTLCVASRDEVSRRVLEVFGGKAQDERISFASVELLWCVLTEKRWAILRAMAGQGAMSIRAVARRAECDVGAVHRDIHVLLSAGILERADDRRVLFAYDAVHVDFTLEAA